MTAIATAFQRAQQRGSSALIAFLAAGDPDLETSAALARAVAAAGADLLELGIPFSDPLADGPIIQAAYTRALEGGVTVRRILEWLPQVAADPGLPVVLMTAWNPVLAYGPDAFCRDAASAGASGLLVPDLLPEDAGPLRESARAAGLDTIFLGAPDTTDERLAAAAGASTGFFYLISRRGVTGPQGGVGEGLESEVARARAHCDVPVAVGFGVSGADDARRVAEVADGVIVGSALVREATEALTRSAEAGTGHSESIAAAASAVAAKTEELIAGMRRAKLESERVET